MNIQTEFNVDKVICDIDVRYYVDCSFSKDGGETWEEDFDDNDESDDYVKSQLPCMKKVVYKYKPIWGKHEALKERMDWCPIIDVNEGKIENWTPGFMLKTHFKVCDQGIYVYSNSDESKQIVSSDCDDYYVPSWLDADGDGYGDYLQISIGEDGKINDWEKLQRKLLLYIKGNLDMEKIKSHIKIEDYVR